MINCPECGAAESACESRFHEFLAREFESEYGAVHHLTVATYMLQHSGRLTAEGWLYERQLLREFLIENKTPAQIRKQHKDRVDSGKRKFKFKADDALPKIARTVWTKTILDVRTEKADLYCSDVTAWAQAALADAEHEQVMIPERH